MRIAVWVALVVLLAGPIACGGSPIQGCGATPNGSIGPCAIGGHKDNS